MPRKLTNKHELPEALYNAVAYDDHEVRGDISVTQLIDSPRIAKLKRENTYEEDVVDLIWAIFGSGVHNVLEKAVIANTEARKMMEVAGTLKNKGTDRDTKAAEYLIEKAGEWFPEDEPDRYETEKYLIHDVEDVTVSGKFDLFDHKEKCLQDYKVVSVYTWMYPEARKKHIAQQNIYAYFLRQLGYQVDKAQLICLFKDFSWGKTGNKNYPPTPIKEIDVPLSSDEKIEKYLKERVRLHKKVWNGKDHQCTPNERWATPDKYAVMATGRKKAIKVFDAAVHGEEEARGKAEQYRQEKDIAYTNDLYVIRRPGENRRCERFCPVAQFCDQYAQIKKEKDEIEMKANQIRKDK